MENQLSYIHLVDNGTNIRDVINHILCVIKDVVDIPEAKQYEIKLVLNELIINSLHYMKDQTAISVGVKLKNRVPYIIYRG